LLLVLVLVGVLVLVVVVVLRACERDRLRIIMMLRRVGMVRVDGRHHGRRGVNNVMLRQSVQVLGVWALQ
jgi:hypothetical protein